MNAGRTARLARLLLALLVVFGVGLRLRIAERGLFLGDEWHTLRVALLHWSELVGTFDRYGSGIGMPLLVRAAMDLGGGSPLAVRAPALVGGVGTLLVTGWLGRRWLGSPAGWIAAALLALNSASIFYSAFARGYSLVCLLSVLLLHATWRLLVEERAGRHLAVVVVVTGLLPYLHLTAASSALSIGGGGVLALLLRGRGRRAGALGLALALGGGLALLLHVPAWESLLEFVGRKHEQKYAGAFDWLDCVAVLPGSRAIAVIGLLLMAPLAALFARSRRSESMPLLFGIVGPALAVAAVRPFGDAHAYARYAIGALPLAALLFAWGLERLGHRLGQVREPNHGAARSTSTGTLGESLAAGGGALLALLAFLGGALGPRHTWDGRFVSAYTTLYPLPPFDRPWPGHSEAYALVAADAEATRVLELPHVEHNGILLLRNAALSHEKDVRTGFLYRPRAEVPASMVTLVDETWGRELAADYVVLHLDVHAEIERYWAWVYGDGGPSWGVDVAAYMRRFERILGGDERPDQRVVQALTEELGAPVFRDGVVIVWKR